MTRCSRRSLSPAPTVPFRCTRRRRGAMGTPILWLRGWESLDDGYEAVESILTLGVAFRRLSSFDRQVVQLRLVENLTQGQIAERIGVSHMQISRLLRRALAQLREFTSTEETHRPS